MHSPVERSRRRRIPVFSLVSAHAISLIGTQLTRVALPWFVLQTTGSAAQAGLTGFAIFLPAFLAGIFGGTLVDRLGYRMSSMGADLVSAVGIGLVPTMYHTLGLEFWQLLLLVFLGSLLDVPGITARRSMVPEAADSAGIRLERVNAIFESSQHISLLLGPALGGILIAWLGASNVLWVDTGTFIVSAAIIGAGIPAIRTDRESAEAGGYLKELAEGLRFLFRDRLLRALAVSLAIMNMVDSPLVAVILPVYADRQFGEATDLGLMITAFGAGSLAGALIYGAIGHRLPRRATWIIGFMAIALPFWALVTEPSLPVIMGVMVASSIASGPINPLLVTVRHERIPPELRGRVFSTFSAIALAAAPIGMVVAGNAIQWLGFRPAVFVFAVVAQLIGISMLFIPAFQEMASPSADRHVPATHSTHK